MGCRLLALCVTVLVALAVCACGAEAGQAAPQPALGRLAAADVVGRAERMESAAMADLRADRLRAAFAGRALRVLSAQVGIMAARGVRVEETAAVVTLVAWNPGPAEAVLQVESQRRLITLDEPDPAWTSSLRQWWSKLRFQSGSWWVVEEQDLAPDNWRSAS